MIFKKIIDDKLGFSFKIDILRKNHFKAEYITNKLRSSEIKNRHIVFFKRIYKINELKKKS